jgi:hypothetical protein
MPDRTKEELEVIKNDLIELKKVINRLNDFGELWPTPMNGKTWEEEKNEFWEREISSLYDLIQSGKVKSCEIKSFCVKEAEYGKRRKDMKGFWNHLGVIMGDSGDVIIGGYQSVDDMINEIDKLVKGDGNMLQKKKINEALDYIGTSACTARALLNKGSQNHLFALEYSTTRGFAKSPSRS